MSPKLGAPKSQRNLLQEEEDHRESIPTMTDAEVPDFAPKPEAASKDKPQASLPAQSSCTMPESSRTSTSRRNDSVHFHPAVLTTCQRMWRERQKELQQGAPLEEYYLERLCRHLHVSMMDLKYRQTLRTLRHCRPRSYEISKRLKLNLLLIRSRIMMMMQYIVLIARCGLMVLLNGRITRFVKGTGKT